MWSLSDPASPQTSVLTMGFNASNPSGYVSVGIPTKAGSMTDATALILQACSTCASGEGWGPSTAWLAGQACERLPSGLLHLAVVCG